MFSASVFSNTVKEYVQNCELHIDKSDFENALLICKKALEKAEDNDRFVGRSIHNFTHVNMILGNFNEAEKLSLKGLKWLKESRPSDYNSLATALNAFGQLLTKTGKYKQATTYLKEALELRKDHYGNEHFYVAQTLGALGLVKKYEGNYLEAINDYKSAIKITSKIEYQMAKRALVAMITNMAVIKLEMGELDEAAFDLNEAIQQGKNFADYAKMEIMYAKVFLCKIKVKQSLYKDAAYIASGLYEESIKFLNSDHDLVLGSKECLNSAQIGIATET